MKHVLFVCNHNAGRSQMAQAFFERLAPPDIRAESAGTEPAAAIWPEVVEVMREVGIDIADRKPKKLTREMQLREHEHVDRRPLLRPLPCRCPRGTADIPAAAGGNRGRG